MVSAWFLAPVFCIQGIQEEIEPKVLPLLALTPLSGASILWSKVASRTGVLGAILLTCTPLAAVTLSFGGVSPLEQVSAIYYIVVGTCVLVLASSVLSFASHRIALPLLAVFSFGVWAFVGIPVLMVLPNAGSSSMEPILDLVFRSIPFMIHPKGVSILNGIFLFAVTPLCIRLWFIGSALMKHKLVAADDRATYGRWPVPISGGIFTVVLAVVSWALGAVLLDVSSGNVSLGFSAMSSVEIWVFVLGALSYLVFYYAASLLYLRLMFFTLGVLERFSWASMLRILNPRQSEDRAPRTRWLKRNPVFWREVFTGGNGASGRMGVLLAFFLMMMWLAVAVVEPKQVFRESTFLMLFVAAYGLTFFSLSVVVTNSVVHERNAEMLQCLLVASMPKRWIITGKVRSAMFRTAPLWIGLGFLWTCSAGFERLLFDAPSDDIPHDFGLFYFPSGAVVCSLVIFWAMQSVVGHVSVLSALWWRNPRTAWVVNMVFTLALWPGLLFAYVMCEWLQNLTKLGGDQQWFSWIGECILPWTVRYAVNGDSYWILPLTAQHFIAGQMIVSIAFWVTAIWMLRRLAIIRLQKGIRV